MQHVALLRGFMQASLTAQGPYVMPPDWQGLRSISCSLRTFGVGVPLNRPMALSLSRRVLVLIGCAVVTEEATLHFRMLSDLAQ